MSWWKNLKKQFIEWREDRQAERQRIAEIVKAVEIRRG